MKNTPSTIINPEAPGIIYVNDRPLILTENAEHYRNHNPEAMAYLLVSGAKPDVLLAAVHRLEQESTPGILIEENDLKQLQASLRLAFQEIKAAGGLVKEPEGNVLMIYRREKWDLPKGKVDEGESIEHAAVREVLEETGLPEVRLLDRLCTSRHIYNYKGWYVLKTTYWFAMTVQGAYQLVPQQEEDITKAEWVNPKDVQIHLQNSYPTIRSVFEKAQI